MSLPKIYPSGPIESLLHRLLRLDQPVPVRTDQELAELVEQNYHWNFIVNLLDGLTFWFGFSFVSATTIVPLFISKLTLNPLMIGLVAVIAQSGWYLPQIFTAGIIEKLPRKKEVVVKLGFFLERLPLWIWVIAAYLANRMPTLSLVLFLTGFAWHYFGAGVIAPAWQDLIANCFPVNRRGRFFGTTMFIGSAIATVMATVSSWILKTYPFPTNFIYIFLIGTLAMNVSIVFLAMTREPVQARPILPTTNMQIRSRLFNILKQNVNFRRFMQARLLLALGGMGTGFLTVATIQRWQISDGTVGIFTASLLIGQTVSHLVAGLLADRFGHKLSLELSGVAAGLAFIIAWLAPSASWYYLVFALIGASIGTILISGTLITLEFSEPDQRPTYVGIANTGVGIASGVAPLLGAWLADYSYEWLFALSAGASLSGLILMHWRVNEPRWHQPTSS